MRKNKKLNIHDYYDACTKKFYDPAEEKKPYRAYNIINKHSNKSQKTFEELQNSKILVEGLQAAEPSNETQKEPETGYITVGVFTALGALPVPNAVVTVYTIDENNEEIVLSHLVTDENGQVPKIELPVVYNPDSPLESQRYFFTTYNLRTEAKDYYTVNILDFRVFPGITTNYNIDMIPVIAGKEGAKPDQTFIIPPSPLDVSNE